MKKVARATSIKLMGVPVTEADPLGAFSANTSPTMQKSACFEDRRILENQEIKVHDNQKTFPCADLITFARK